MLNQYNLHYVESTSKYDITLCMMSTAHAHRQGEARVAYRCPCGSLILCSLKEGGWKLKSSEEGRCQFRRGAARNRRGSQRHAMSLWMKPWLSLNPAMSQYPCMSAAAQYLHSSRFRPYFVICYVCLSFFFTSTYRYYQDYSIVYCTMASISVM